MTIDPTCPPPDHEPARVTTPLPPGSCDSHCHVFGPVARFPYAATRTYTPPEAPASAVRRLHRALGIARAVFTQPAAHGSDHSAMLDAIAEAHGSARGVALVTEDTSDRTLDELALGGIVGARMNFVPSLAPVPSDDDVRRLVDRIAPLGWHLAVHLQGDGITRVGRLLAELGIPVVIDHMARISVSGVDYERQYASLSELLLGGSAWVKLSGSDRMVDSWQRIGEAVDLASRLAQEAPDRVLWGTDFPHPNSFAFMPNDGELANLIERIAPDQRTRHALLVDNPTKCFGFTVP